MKVSIITPAFNSARTILDTLHSVKTQSYADVEHIVIDGMSSDGTVELVRSRFPDVICISEKDNGIYDAMNKGIRHATGDIIGILNSDDFYANGSVLARVVTMFDMLRCEALYGDLVYVDNKNKEKIVRRWNAGEFQRDKFLTGWMPPHPTFFVRREVYDELGLYDESLRTSADYELMLRFLYKHKVSVGYLPHCLVCMRTGGQSNASLRHRLQANREDRIAWKRNGIKPRFYTTLFKPLRKIPQFIKKSQWHLEDEP